MKQIPWRVRYRSAEQVTLNNEDNIKVISVTDDGDIILSVNGKRITLTEQERLINLNI